MSHDVDELTPAMRAMLGALPRTRVPSAALENRVVGALRERGLLRRLTQSPRFGGASWRRLTQVAGIAAVFVAGMFVGRGTTPASTLAMQHVESGKRIEGTQLPPTISRVGAAYVASLAMIPADTVDSIARIALKVARSTFGSAARELVRRMPADSIVALLAPMGIRVVPLASATRNAAFTY